jgi:AP-1 complex subunit beta-1
MIRFGLAPAQALSIPHPLPPNQSIEVAVPLTTAGQVQRMDPVTTLQVAVKNNIDVFYFQALVPFHVLLTEDGLVADRESFMGTFGDAECPAVSSTLPLSGTLEDIKGKLMRNNVFCVHQMGPTVCQL